MAKLVAWLLGGSQQPFLAADLRGSVVNQLEAAGVDTEEIRSLREQLARLGQT